MSNPNTIVHEFLYECEPIYHKLVHLRAKGWADPRGDDYFRRQRQRADNPGNNGALRFYNMMQEIGDEMEQSTHAFTQSCGFAEGIAILDLCMAPGGYTASALKYNPGAAAFGITLPPSKGGHGILLPSSQSSILLLDITMLATEFGVEKVPLIHPEHASFISDRPFFGKMFQLVFCDGQVLRTHQRAEYREQQEAHRLTVSQLILGLQRISTGGTMIVLLHKMESWDNMELLYLFSRFSSVHVFKPKKKHAIRSSFYLIAKDVQPHTDSAKMAVAIWKQTWWHTTFGGKAGTGDLPVPADEVYIRATLDKFGREFVELGRPVWETQASALSAMYFVK